MPLYRLLCRLKIEEVGFNRAIYTTDKGNYKANPVFREMRETIKQIEQIWKTLNLDVTVPPIPRIPNPVDGPQRDRNIVPMLTGDGKGYYSQLEQGVVPKTKRVVRRRRIGDGEDI
jgi:hypothetical protein